MSRRTSIVGLLALSSVLATVALLYLFGRHPVEKGNAPRGDGSVQEAGLVFSQDKQRIAGISVEPVVRQDLSLTRMLPGRFQYDGTRHVAVRPAVAGVLEEVLVKPGQQVQQGQALAIVRSPAVGQARSDVLTRNSRLELAEAALSRHEAVRLGVENLVLAIKNREPVDSIQERFGGATIGELGGNLIGRYSQAIFSSRLSQTAHTIGDAGVISGRVMRQRETTAQQAASELQAATDQALFIARQAADRARAERDAAERDLRIAKQSLAAVMGIPTSLLPADQNEAARDLARYELPSPLSGAVERIAYSASERMDVLSEAFVVADTTQLWVEADIRGRDWSALQLQPGDPVVVTTPAIPDARFAAEVYYAGREVDSLSGALPLVAIVRNDDGALRPGLHAHVEAPTGEVRNVLAVPASAIVNLDGKPTVFVQRRGRFLPRDVRVGVASNDLVEVKSGLAESDHVVVAGAFVLMSELLLAEED